MNSHWSQWFKLPKDNRTSAMARLSSSDRVLGRPMFAFNGWILTFWTLQVHHAMSRSLFAGNLRFIATRTRVVVSHNRLYRGFRNSASLSSSGQSEIQKTTERFTVTESTDKMASGPGPSIPWSTMNKPISAGEKKTAKPPPPPSPSASTILISQSNRILLLHRKKTSSSFPSAHVFPGGNLEPSDGDIAPESTDPARHIDNLAYRTGAIRELFEESGILLARESVSSDAPLLTLDQETRLAGRNEVHSGKTDFRSWLSKQSNSAQLDTESLIPFTHWITPTNVPKRFTTQMYVYFVPVTERRRHLLATADEVETMSPEWGTARSWIDRARRGEIILFPPQFILLYLVSSFLDRPGEDPENPRDIPEEERMKRREALQRFIETDASPVPWKDKYISPVPIAQSKDGRNILGLDKAGPELRNSNLKGDESRVVLVRFSKEGPREVEVVMRNEVQDILDKAQAKARM